MPWGFDRAEPEPTPPPGGLPAVHFVARLPHDGWSEGLDLHEGELWHAFPHSIRVYDPETGEHLRRYDPSSGYSESLTWVGDVLYNVSYSDSNIYAGTLNTAGTFDWTVAGTTPEIHAWGIAFDGTHLILTGNGTENLYFLDPATMELAYTVVTPVDDLEDIAFGDGVIWASSYTEHAGSFFRIDPLTGAVLDVIALPDAADCPIVDGIAVTHDRVYVTGKDCPHIHVGELRR